MRVLSLFDGISCAYEGITRAGIKVNEYYACEIDKYAIKVSQTNHPDIIRPVNDVRFLSKLMLPEIDIMIGGSPCQDLSIAKKGRKGLGGDRSGLFWEYVRVLKEVKPKWFILENVASMPKADRDIITEAMGVEPVMFNASLVSAQSRKRLFWTNIKFELPADKGIVLKDILEPDVPSKVCAMTMSVPSKRETIRVGNIGNGDSQANRVYSTDGKSSTLSANGGGGGAKTGLYAIGRDIGRRLDDTGTRKDHDASIPIQRRIELRTDDKCGTLTSVLKDNMVVCESMIRTLTPIECERLQGLPDDYTAGISNTQRYKCLGNAFNADVIAHITSSICIPDTSPVDSA